MSWKSWIQAARPLAQGNIALPLLFGQALAFAVSGEGSLIVLGLVGLWGVLDQLFIVFANDFADRHDDPGGDAKTLFSGGSGVLPEGKLRPGQLLVAALGAYALLGVLSVGLDFFRCDAPWLSSLWLLGGVLVWAYSYGPLRLSYRGNGEVLQGLGVGVVLPLVGYAAQRGNLDALPWLWLLPSFVFAFASNIMTALPDFKADRRANKRTWPVRFGLPKAAWGAAGLLVAGHWLLNLAALARFGAQPLLALGVLPILACPFVSLQGRRGVLTFVIALGLSIQIGLALASWLLWQGSL